MIPLVGMMYKSFGKHKKECMAAFEQSDNKLVKIIRIGMANCYPHVLADLCETFEIKPSIVRWLLRGR